jgi:hypothetical protein
VDLEGNVCLNILREDWKPVLNLNSVMVGLQYLFLEPNADDPLNKGEKTILPMTMFIAEHWSQMQPRSYGETGSSLYTTLSIPCEEAMSRVSNTQTFLPSL